MNRKRDVDGYKVIFKASPLLAHHQSPRSCAPLSEQSSLCSPCRDHSANNEITILLRVERNDDHQLVDLPL